MKYKLLNELANLNNKNLTDAQKYILVACASSATPSQAFEQTIGNPTLVTAREVLADLGLITVKQNEMGLTASGRESLINYNLIDDTNQLTDDAKSIIAQMMLNLL